ncbi:MAG TPA: zf-HC2 domain-containing protein [Pirellulales bacterium]|nr:zf-HC2 domain-containing protein [Pirellulales bacterium]
MNPIPDDQPDPGDKANGGRKPPVDAVPSDKANVGRKPPVHVAVHLARDDELLTAYLDGELTADERRRVETLLADQPESRQLLDELRALGGTLASVPRYRLDADFASRVLRAAERTMLSGEVAALPVNTAPIVSAAGPPHHADDLKLAGSDDEAGANGRSRDDAKLLPASQHEAVWSSTARRWSWQRARRPLAWVGVMLAASVLIMIAERGQVGGPGPRQVALARKDAVPNDNAARNAPNAEIATPQGHRGALSDEYGQSLGQNVDRKLDEGDDRSKSQKRIAPDQSRTDAPASGPLGDAPPAPASQPGMVPRTFGGGRGGGAGFGAGGLGGGGANPPSRDAQMQETLDEMQRRLSSLRGEVEQESMSFGYSHLSRDETLLIVECEVPSGLVDRPEFQQILAKNNIVLEVTAQRESQGIDPAAKQTLADGAEAAAEEEADKPETAKSGAAKPEAGKPGTTVDALQNRWAFHDENVTQRALAFYALAQGQVDGLLVEGTQEQLAGMVADLQQHSDLFYSVAVEPAPDAPEQQELTAFNRRREVALHLEQAADAALPSAVPLPAPAADEAPKAKALDKRDADEPADGSDAAEEPTKEATLRAMPLGRALRLETRKSAAVEEKAGDQDVESATAKAKAVEETRTRAKSPAPALGATGRPKAEPAADDGKKDVADKAFEQMPPAGVEAGFAETGRLSEARRGLDRGTAPRRALLIFRTVAPAGGERLPAAKP